MLLMAGICAGEVYYTDVSPCVITCAVIF